MATQGHSPRKRRTRQHVIADLSVHHVEGIVLEAGHTVQVMVKDYGYDLLMFTYDTDGYLEPELAFLQVKASESLLAIGSSYVFDLDVRDYHLWTRETLPMVLVLFDAGRRRAVWLAIQDYFRENNGRRPKAGAKTIRVHIPEQQVFNVDAVSRIREMKNTV